MTQKEIINNLTKDECINLIDKYFTIKDILKNVLNVKNPQGSCFKQFIKTLQKYEIISKKLERARFSSPISRISSEDFKTIFYSSTSVKECLSFFGLDIKGWNYKTLKRRCEKEGLDYNYLVTNPNKVFHSSKKYKTEEMFFENSSISTNTIKKRIIKENLLPYFCQICKKPPSIIKNKIETLVLDHINGINNDHRLKNLQFVCGTCNLHLDTTGSKNKKNKSFIPSKEEIEIIKKEQENKRNKRKITIKNTEKFKIDKRICLNCKKNTIRQENISGLCIDCLNEEKSSKYHINEVFQMVQKDGYEKTGRYYGVSGNAIKKLLKLRGLNPLEKKSTENFLKMAFELQKFFLLEKKVLPSLEKDKELFLFISSVREKNQIGTLKREEKEILDGISLRILNPFNKEKDLVEKISQIEEFIIKNNRGPKRTNKDKKEDTLAEWIKTAYRYNIDNRISKIESLFEKYGILK